MSALFCSILLLIGMTGEDLRDNISDYLNAHLQGFENVEFEILKQPADYKSIEIMNEKKFKRSGNIAYIPVKLIESKREARSYITIKLKLYKKVLVAIRDIKRKERINQFDFDLSIEDVAGVNSNPIEDSNVFTKLRSNKNLKEGTILTENDVEKIPVVMIGDKLKASVVEGNVMIQTDAVSKQEGAVGDIITVSTPEHKKFKAKIVDNNNVIIIE